MNGFDYEHGSTGSHFTKCVNNMTDDLHNPRYPLYIVSKKRADTRLTSKALEKMKVPYFIVIEQADYEDYAAVIDPSKILILPERYFDEYDCFDDLGRTKST